MRVQVHAADLGGCGHYRLIWPTEALYNDGADVDLVLPAEAKASFEVKADLAATMQTGERVAGDLERLPDADIVVLQRPLTAGLVHVIGKLKAAGIVVVVEVDDDFQTIDPANAAWPTVQPNLNPGRNWQHLAEACRLADLVTVTTPALAARYGRHGRVRIIPNYVPRHYLFIAHADHDPLRLGWSGSIDTHPRDLQVTRGAVDRVLARHDLKFHLIGSGKTPHRGPSGEPITDDAGNVVEVTDHRVALALSLRPNTSWAHTGGWIHLEKYPQALAELDIGIVPLADTAFNEAKSWLKGLEFAAVGVPFVATPTGAYRQLAELGIGALAVRPRDWERELSRLVADDDYRLERAGEGRRIANRLTIEDHAGEWLDAWHHAAELAPRNRKALA